jgi:hypothetical protein
MVEGNSATLENPRNDIAAPLHYVGSGKRSVNTPCPANQPSRTMSRPGRSPISCAAPSTSIASFAAGQ